MDYNALRRYITRLTDRGWRDLDPGKRGGIFCVAILISPCNTMVAKFCDTEPDYGRVDGWPAYIKMCAIRHSIHAPKVFVARELRGKIFLGITERLYHLPVDDYDFTPKGFVTPEVRDLCLEAKAVSDVSMHCHRPEQSYLWYNMTKAAQAFLKAINDSVDWPSDLHVNNLMYRRKGRSVELVFNDPIGGIRAPGSLPSWEI